MVRSRTRAALVACLLAFAPVALASVKNDFGLYPSGAQGCLEDADASSNCSGDTVPEMNACLCSNGGSFVTNSARCIGREAPETLRTVWNTMSTSCDDSNTPLEVTEDDFISTGQRETANPTTRSVSSTSASSTSTQSSTATNSETTSTPTGEDKKEEDENDGGGGGLSVAAKAAIGVGSVVGAAILGGIIAMWLKTRRSRAAHDEARQAMLHSPEGGVPPGGAAFAPYGAEHRGWKGAEEKNAWRPASTMTGYTSTTTDGAQSWLSSHGSPPPGHHSWGHHPDQPWPGSPPPSQAAQSLAAVPEQGVPNQGPGVYELSSTDAAMIPPPGHHAFEMSASPAPGARMPPHYPGSNWAR